MVKILAVADEVAYNLTPGRIRSLDLDLVVACGDLPWSYLEMIASSMDSPMVFVPGNHDPAITSGRESRSGVWYHHGRMVEAPRPHGLTNLDVNVADVAGLRIAGLGGCVRYRPGPHQYSQREYDKRAKKLLKQVAKLAKKAPRAPGLPSVDLLLTHAPPRGVGDDDDRPHLGIEALHSVIETLAPPLHLHGHIHPHGRTLRDRVLGATTIRNIIPYRVLEVPLASDVAA